MHGDTPHRTERARHAGEQGVSPLQLRWPAYPLFLLSEFVLLLQKFSLGVGRRSQSQMRGWHECAPGERWMAVLCGWRAAGRVQDDHLFASCACNDPNRAVLKWLSVDRCCNNRLQYAGHQPRMHTVLWCWPCGTLHAVIARLHLPLLAAQRSLRMWYKNTVSLFCFHRVEYNAAKVVAESAIVRKCPSPALAQATATP